MENLLERQLDHVLEFIFEPLSAKDLESCEQVCCLWNNYLKRVYFKQAKLNSMLLKKDQSEDLALGKFHDLDVEILESIHQQLVVHLLSSHRKRNQVADHPFVHFDFMLSRKLSDHPLHSFKGNEGHVLHVLLQDDDRARVLHPVVVVVQGRRGVQDHHADHVVDHHSVGMKAVTSQKRQRVASQVLRRRRSIA